MDSELRWMDIYDIYDTMEKKRENILSMKVEVSKNEHMIEQNKSNTQVKYPNTNTTALQHYQHYSTIYILTTHHLT